MPKHCANMRCPEQDPVQAKASARCGRIKRQTTIEFAMFVNFDLPFGDPDQAQPPVSGLQPPAASSLRSQPLPRPVVIRRIYLVVFAVGCLQLMSIRF